MQTIPVTLVELNGQIKKIIKSNFETVWLTAEISEMTINYSGHCYLEFIQKENDSERIVARARGTIWNQNFRMIKPYFETTTGQPFSQGLKVMVRVTVDYHEVYGLGLNVIDIEPTYTVGELVVRKQKILEKLQSEGVIDMNKELELAYIPNRIAVISSLTAAGYEDFYDQLKNNSSGYYFYIRLFPAVMQGNEAENSIINQLDKIYQHHTLFDAVIIIRGGGSQADLDCFNSYWLAYNITQFPLPVLTGIGHEQDDSVTDVVAHTRLKTPTAVAEFLIDSMNTVENDLKALENSIMSSSQEIIADKKNGLKEIAYKLNNSLQKQITEENKDLAKVTSSFYSQLKNNLYRLKLLLNKEDVIFSHKIRAFIQNKRNEIIHLNQEMQSTSRISFKNQLNNLILLEQKVNLSDPKHILKRGYSITHFNGKPITDSTQLKSGDEIETTFNSGKSKSIVK